jgi:DNA-binding NtrC family response regulator
MTAKKITELAEQFEALTIKSQMRILADKAVNSRYLFYKEITEEFERTLLQALLDKYDHNVLKMSASVKLHRNTIAKKMKKLKMKEKKAKPRP